MNNMKYFTFGMREMRITQNYNGTTSVKTFDYENQTVTLTIKNSSGTIIKSITKHLKA